MEGDVGTLKKIYEMIILYSVQYGLRLLIAAVILFAGWKFGGWAERLTHGLLQKRHVDITLSKFIAWTTKLMVVAFAILIALDKVGITISPLIAAVSAMIFGASFAIQAPLSNYAAGLSIIFSRPFVVGDTIGVKGYNGVVTEVKLPCTILATGEGERITIPNKDIVGEVIVNSKEYRVADGQIGISYANDPEKAIAVVRGALAACSFVRQNPAPEVGIASFGDSSIAITYRSWVLTTQFLKDIHEINLAVYQAVRAAGLSIPFPQREVRVLAPQENGSAAQAKTF